MFDVDNFKQINDHYGHVQGDVCLAEIAECIKKVYANDGYCYRTGGDEFCVLLKNSEKESADRNFYGVWRRNEGKSRFYLLFLMDQPRFQVRILLR